MEEKPGELRKLFAIASDLELSVDLRVKAIDSIRRMSSHEALLALLELAANEKLLKEERDLALKRAREIVKAGH